MSAVAPPGAWYRRWITTQPEPRSQMLVRPPRPATAHVRLYDGTVADVDVLVVARSEGVLCVEQDVTGDHEGTTSWHAWVDSDRVRPR